MCAVTPSKHFQAHLRSKETANAWKTEAGESLVLSSLVCRASSRAARAVQSWGWGEEEEEEEKEKEKEEEEEVKKHREKA